MGETKVVVWRQLPRKVMIFGVNVFRHVRKTRIAISSATKIGGAVTTTMLFVQTSSEKIPPRRSLTMAKMQAATTCRRGSSLFREGTYFFVNAKGSHSLGNTNHSKVSGLCSEVFPGLCIGLEGTSVFKARCVHKPFSRPFVLI